LFQQGLKKTYDWYCKNKDPKRVRAILDAGGLIQRKVAN
jgi:hypothetical protein